MILQKATVWSLRGESLGLGHEEANAALGQQQGNTVSVNGELGEIFQFLLKYH